MPSMVKWSKVSKVAQSCLTLCDPMNCSLPVHGIFQARVLEWVAISFPRSSSQPRDQTQVYHTAGRHFTPLQSCHQMPLLLLTEWYLFREFGMFPVARRMALGNGSG